VSRTSDATVEELERLFVRMMACVAEYKDKGDRTRLPQDLLSVINAATKKT
jgi:hypothetical protein